MQFFAAALTLSICALGAIAAPGPVEKRSSPTQLSAAQVASYTPYAWYASTGYCHAPQTIAWNCGVNCEANPQFEPIASGGDGVITQYWFVGYDPSLQSVIVVHQGTDIDAIIPDLTDLDFFLTPVESNLFPGLSSGIKVHNGFQSTFSRSIVGVLPAVKSAMQKYGATHVTTVGHSLGAAIALLDAVYLPLHLPAGTTFSSVVFGLPRVGNKAFANYVDSSASNVHLTHINNQRDPIPTLPPRLLGFVHPSGEVHIDYPTDNWYACPGQDNTNGLCELGDVPNILDWDANNHDGPYGSVTMDCGY